MKWNPVAFLSDLPVLHVSQNTRELDDTFIFSDKILFIINMMRREENASACLVERIALSSMSIVNFHTNTYKGSV